MEDAYEKINNWVNEYNNFRSHSSLNDSTPAEFIAHHIAMESKNQTLPGAPVDEAMYVASVEHSPAVSENTYLHQQLLPRSISDVNTTDVPTGFIKK